MSHAVLVTEWGVDPFLFSLSWALWLIHLSRPSKQLSAVTSLLAQGGVILRDTVREAVDLAPHRSFCSECQCHGVGGRIEPVPKAFLGFPVDRVLESSTGSLFVSLFFSLHFPTWARLWNLFLYFCKCLARFPTLFFFFFFKLQRKDIIIQNLLGTPSLLECSENL